LAGEIHGRLQEGQAGSSVAGLVAIVVYPLAGLLAKTGSAPIGSSSSW
jgi:hypothetical protein